MKLAWVAMGLTALLGACGPKISQLQASCEATNQSFVGMVSCTKSEIAREYPDLERQPDGDLVRVYLAYADAAAAHVTDGTMSEPDARAALAELYARLKTQSEQRIAMAQMDQAARYQQFLNGLAYYSAVTAPPPSNITTYKFAGQPAITCVDVSPNYVTCR